MMTDPLVNAIIQLAEASSEVNSLWLYGSRSKGNATAISDYDLAIGFTSRIQDRLESRLRPELQAITWATKLQLPQAKLSIIDINQAPIALAFNAINGTLLYCKDQGQRMATEAIIMSKIELDHQYHQDHYER